MAVNLYEQVRKNRRNSVYLVIFFFFFVLLLGFISGLVFSLVYTGTFNLAVILFSLFISMLIALGYIFVFFQMGDSMVLGATHAKEVTKKDYPYLYHTVEGISIAAGMKTVPKCYIIEDDALNAYATGLRPEKSYIVVTSGLLKKLNRQELEGVIAHEMSHIKNEDIKVMLIAAGLVGAIVLISDFLFRSFLFMPQNGGGGGNNNKNGQIMIIVFVVWIVFVILSPIVAQMIKLAISRRREYLADSNGALYTRYPEGLASALEKIKNDPDPLVDYANRATAHLFISTPFRKKKTTSMFSNLFSTHPPIEERIKRLRGMN